jgi:hypothetical protein
VQRLKVDLGSYLLFVRRRTALNLADRTPERVALAMNDPSYKWSRRRRFLQAVLCRHLQAKAFRVTRSICSVTAGVGCVQWAAETNGKAWTTWGLTCPCLPKVIPSRCRWTACGLASILAYKMTFHGKY